MHARGPQLQLFSRFQRPTLAVTAPLEIADPRPAAKAAGVPVSAFLVWMLAAGAMKVPEMRLRLSGGGVLEVSELTVSFTVLSSDGGLRFAYAPFEDSLPAFAQAYRSAAHAAAADESLQSGDPTHDHVYLSVAPWMTFTAVEQPYADQDAASIPSMVIGRMREVAPGRVEAPLGVQVHHGLVDGVHLARFFAALPDIADAGLAQIRRLFTQA